MKKNILILLFISLLIIPTCVYANAPPYSNHTHKYVEGNVDGAKYLYCNCGVCSLKIPAKPHNVKAIAKGNKVKITWNSDRYRDDIVGEYLVGVNIKLPNRNMITVNNTCKRTTSKTVITKSKTIKIRLFCRDRNRNEKYSKWITINVR